MVSSLMCTASAAPRLWVATPCALLHWGTPGKRLGFFRVQNWAASSIKIPLSLPFSLFFSHINTPFIFTCPSVFLPSFRLLASFLLSPSSLFPSPTPAVFPEGLAGQPHGSSLTWAPQLYHMPAVWPWTNHFTSLSLSSLLFQMTTMVAIHSAVRVCRRQTESPAGRGAGGVGGLCLARGWQAGRPTPLWPSPPPPLFLRLGQMVGAARC